MILRRRGVGRESKAKVKQTFKKQGARRRFHPRIRARKKEALDVLTSRITSHRQLYSTAYEHNLFYNYDDYCPVPCHVQSAVPCKRRNSETSRVAIVSWPTISVPSSGQRRQDFRLAKGACI